MSKYNIARITFLLALIGCLYLQNFSLTIAVTLVFVGVLSAGAFFIRWNFYHTSMHCLSNSSALFLTFDDGPHPQLTSLVLDMLKKHQCKATFFCIGNKIKGNEHLLQRMVAEGHTVGIHTWSHSYWFDLLPTYKMKQEIVATQLEIQRATGLVPTLFRPPYGVTNPMLARAMKYTHVTSIGWTIRSLDTVIKSSEKIIAKITPQLSAKRILLLHDTQPCAVEILQSVINTCASSNLLIGDIQQYVKCYR